MGLELLVGGTGQRKTTLAQFLCSERADERGVSVVILDPEGVLHYDGALEFREIPPSQEMVDAIWTNGEHVIYTPRNDEDAIKFIDMVRRGGNVVFLVDECSHYAQAGVPAIKAMLRLCRVHRLVGVDLYFTTQAPKDIHPRIWNIRHKVYIFHQEDEGSLEYIQAQLRLPDSWVARIRELAPGQAILWVRNGGTSNAKAPKQTPAPEIPEAPRGDPGDPDLRVGDAAAAGGRGDGDGGT